MAEEEKTTPAAADAALPRRGNKEPIEVRVGNDGFAMVKGKKVDFGATLAGALVTVEPED